MNASDNFNFGEMNQVGIKAQAALVEKMGVLRHNTITPIIIRANGDIEIGESVTNSRTDAGASFVANQIGGTLAANSAHWLALAPTQITPAHGDTTLTGEISSNGCARAAAMKWSTAV